MNKIYKFSKKKKKKSKPKIFWKLFRDLLPYTKKIYAFIILHKKIYAMYIYMSHHGHSGKDKKYGIIQASIHFSLHPFPYFPLSFSWYFFFSFKFVIFFLFIQFLFNIKILFIYWDVGAMAQDPGSDCDFVGSCKNKADCAKPCGAKGHSPTAVLCVPNPNGGKRCCCIIAW